MSAAEVIANAGSALELVSPERFFAPEMGGMNHVPYMRAFHEKGVKVTINTRLKAVRRDGNVLVATLASDFADGWSEERRIDQVVVEHGTAPIDDLYFGLKPASSNLGVVDYAALTADDGEYFPAPSRTARSRCSGSATPSPRATSMPPSTTASALQSRL